MNFDLLIIGTGTAAMIAATRVRHAGWSVAVIDEKPFGGTCALRGCDPKKMLIAGAEVIDAQTRMHDQGVAGSAAIDWPELIAFKRSFTDPIPGRRERLYEAKGISAFHGSAHFEGPDRLVVDGTTLTGRHVLIASGAEPVRLGINVVTGTAVVGVEQAGAGFRVHTRSARGEDIIEADMVVHAAGRIPALDRLNLAAGDIATENGRLKLNPFLQSVSNPRVYAAGDAAQQGPPLTPVSSHDAKVVAANLLDGNTIKPDYRGVPSVVFTLPPIASVGLGEKAAKDAGLRYRVKSERTSDWFTARRMAEKVYGYKTLVEEGTGRLIGAHLVGPHADEVINIFGLAIRHGLTADHLKSTMFAYPTGASDIGDML